MFNRFLKDAKRSSADGILGFYSSLFVGRTRPRVNNRGVSGFVNLETKPWPGEGERCLGWAPADEDRNLALLNLSGVP